MKLAMLRTALLLALLIFLGSCAVSCGDKTQPDDTTTNSIEDTVSDDTVSDSQKAYDVFISEKGTMNFSLVISEDMDEYNKSSVEKLYALLVESVGSTTIKLENANTENYSSESTEILIGNTDYPETQEALNSIGYGEWTIKFVGNKLVVAGFSKMSINDAITRLMKLIKDDMSEDGTFILSSDFNYTKVRDEMVNHLPRFEENTEVITAVEGQDTTLAIARGMTVEKYDAYLKKITDAGYTLYTTNAMAENKFSTYQNNEYVIHAGYYAYESSCRVTIEKKNNLPALQKDNVWTKNDNVVTSLAQVGLTEKNGTGMAYCVQLADGSFIVVDGGIKEGSDYLYDYMKAKAPNGEITIAAWLITHVDGDHREAFDQFANKYSELVKLEMLLINYAGSDQYMEAGFDEVESTYKNVLLMTGCKLFNVHTGQKFYIRNAVLEMLYTPDSYWPKKANHNENSLVFTIEVEGERILFTGDVSEIGANILEKMYGDYLKSDILQLAHHGMRNGYGVNMPNTIKLYQKIRPEIVLWPSSNAQYLNNTLDDSVRIALMKWNHVALESARECYMAGRNTTVLELPYRSYSAYTFDPTVTRVPVCADAPSSSDRLKFELGCGEGTIKRVDWYDSVVE